ncbi:hypothetical protein EV363DRAFT_1193009 [Boletus edulis]|nr:hypothetical protein EV363DRAFT_1193009 [Boletus edulis]
MKSLCLVHPWLDALVEHEDERGGVFVEEDVVPPASPTSDDEETFDDEIDYEEIDDDSSSFAERELVSLSMPTQTALIDREMGARRLVARLRQPFGALLFTPASMRRRTMDYKRVAADSLITVRFRDNVSLANIVDNVRILDVL